MTQTRMFSIIVGIAVVMASTGQLHAQQPYRAGSNQLLPAREFLFTSAKPQPSDKLRSDMLKLVADSRAGRIAPQAQLPASKVHNLSKTAKIAIIAGVAIVVLTIVVVHGVNNLHCESRCVL
jgi:hypothetical protein